MKRLARWVAGFGAAGLLAVVPRASADTTNAAPDFKEVSDLIRANLAGLSEADLNQAEVRGLVEQLHGRVALVSGQNDSGPAPEGPLAIQANALDGGIACFRINQVTGELAQKLAAAEKQLAATNTNSLKGIVLDLRFADGSDYQAAADTAGLFLADEQPLLDWGGGVVKSKANDHAISLPLVVLVNQKTSGAAEALAAVLRQNAHAVLLGATTAGETMVGRNFPLNNGQYLRIAMATVKLGNGDTLTPAGVKPDIAVAVKPDAEKLYFADPYKDLAAATNAHSTNGVAASTRRLSEADLIRERKERPGMDLEYMPLPDDTAGDGSAGSARSAQSAKPVVHDPVLARALDLIKGIAAFRTAHSP